MVGRSICYECRTPIPIINTQKTDLNGDKRQISDKQKAKKEAANAQKRSNHTDRNFDDIELPIQV